MSNGQNPDTSLVSHWFPSPNFEPRRNGRKPDLLLLHYTAMTSGSAAIEWLHDPASKVSCHYLIDVDGTIIQMVPESARAWHAGRSCWAGETDINSCSIGIEIQNLGSTVSPLPDFPEQQMVAVQALCQDILTRHPIPAERVLAHSDVAPARKADPGERFDWRRLHFAGIGHWVEPVEICEGPRLALDDKGEEVLELQNQLSSYGYNIQSKGYFDDHTEVVVRAFQRHFRPVRVDGIADFSTQKTLKKLLHAVKNPKF